MARIGLGDSVCGAPSGALPAARALPEHRHGGYEPGADVDGRDSASWYATLFAKCLYVFFTLLFMAGAGFYLYRRRQRKRAVVLERIEARRKGGDSRFGACI